MAEAPAAAVVIVRAEAYLLPTMERYRAGARGRWTTVAAYPFTTAERIDSFVAGSGLAEANR